MAYEGGYTSAVNSATQRASVEAETARRAELMKELIEDRAREEQERQEDKKHKANAMEYLAALMPKDAPQAPMPQVPPPGAPSVPMMPPGAPPPGMLPPGGMAPGRQMPPPGAGGSAAQLMTAAAQGPQPQPQAPPAGWKPSPMASPALGGPPPAAAPVGPPSGGAAAGGGLPPPMPGAGGAQPTPGGAQKELPAPMLSVPLLIQEMKKKGVAPGEMYATLEKALPIIEAQNRAAVQEMGIQLKAAEAGRKAMETELHRLKEAKGPAAVQTAKFAATGEPGADLVRDKLKREGTLTKSQRVGGAGAGGAGGPGPEPKANEKEVVDWYAMQQMMGDVSWRTGLARNKSGSALIEAVDRRIPGMAKEFGLGPGEVVANKAGIASLMKAIVDRQKFVATGNQFVRNMQSQADLVEKYMEKGTAGGVPALNKWIQAGRQQIAGDADVSALDTAIRGLAREHQRIVTGVTSNAQLHVSAQETADKLLNKDQAPEQMKATIKVMREEADNAVKAGRAEVEDLKNQIRSGEPGKKKEVGGDDLKGKVEAAGEKYEPDKYDYRITDGKVQRKLKGS